MESDTYTITSYIAGAIHEESSSNDADEAMAEYRRMSEAEPCDRRSINRIVVPIAGELDSCRFDATPSLGQCAWFVGREDWPSSQLCPK